MSAILFRAGRVIDPGAGRDGPCDVLVRDGVIASLGRAGTIAVPDGVREVEARRWWVVPGLIDAHVHLRDPGFPEKETIASGLRAAAAGGFTAVAAMANTRPVNDRPEVTRYMLERAQETAGARLVPVSAVTRGLEGRALVDFEAMAEAGARLFSDDGLPLDDPVVLAEALKAAERVGRAISLHEEDRSISEGGAVNAGPVARALGVKGVPAEAESAGIRRDLELASASKARLHVAHVSTADSLALIRAAKRRGIGVTCEATPHHFSLDESAVLKWGTYAKMSPPLRARGDVEALRASLADGTVDLIATDHAPHDAASKGAAALEGCFGSGREPRMLRPEEAEAFERAANGVVGLETALGLSLALVHDGVIDAARLVELMSLNPARLLGLAAGTLNVGAVADLTVIDPAARWTVERAKIISKSRNTPFTGMELRGRAVLTVVGGEIVYDARPSERT